MGKPRQCPAAPAPRLFDPRLAAKTHYPSPIQDPPLDLSEEEKIHQIADHFRQIMDVLGLDLQDPSLAMTPERVARMYVTELFSGLQLDAFPTMSFIEDSCTTPALQQVVFLKVGFTSFCEHHFVPMVGEAFVGYVPNKRLLGFSKFSRVVRYFSRRPQLQERLTAQIADALAIVLETEDISVSLQAKHYCVIARGVEDESSDVTSQVLGGRFQEDSLLRQQFLAYLEGQ